MEVTVEVQAEVRAAAREAEVRVAAMPTAIITMKTEGLHPRLQGDIRVVRVCAGRQYMGLSQQHTLGGNGQRTDARCKGLYGFTIT